MTDMYQVAAKRSVRREQTVPNDAYNDDNRLVFESEAAAETWVAKHNESSPSLGQLFLRAPDPEDNSDIDAYLVFRQPNLCEAIDDRQTSVVAGGHEPRSGTLFLNEATQELFTFAYATDEYAVCIDHGHTHCDPKGIRTIDLDTFGEYRQRGRFRALDVV